MRRLAAWFVIAIGLVLCGRVDADARGPDRTYDWTGVEVAWRNDPRPAADAAVPVEPPPSRRTTRRGQRRGQRRIEVEAPPPRATAAIPPAVAIPMPTAPPPSMPLVVERPAQDRTVVHDGQPYGSDPRQRFDLHLPAGCSGDTLPLVVWIDGPDWRTRGRDDCPVLWLAEQGFAVAVVDYRTSDDAVFPAQLDDCRAALRALCSEATTWGIDPTRICVAGSRGGGHLAALVAFAPPDQPPIREASVDEPVDDVAAVAMFDAPTHLPSLGADHDRAGSAESRLVGGPLPEFREVAQKASPLVHVSADDPPTLIVQGSRGDGVAIDQGERLDAALRAAGVDSALVVLDASAAALAPRQGTAAGGAFVEFLDRTLGPAGPRIEP
jgi:acetyl esterase/lipase